MTVMRRMQTSNGNTASTDGSQPVNACTENQLSGVSEPVALPSGVPASNPYVAPLFRPNLNQQPQHQDLPLIGLEVPGSNGVHKKRKKRHEWDDAEEDRLIHAVIVIGVSGWGIPTRSG